MDATASPHIQPGISAVLPIERGRRDVESLILDLAAVLDGLVAENYEIIVVEFGSGHSTPGLLADLTARCPTLPLRVVPHTAPDRARAQMTGFEASGFDLLFVTTTDGQFDVLELNHLLEAIEHGADVAAGYRTQRADGLPRRLAGWVRHAVLSIAFGPTARDTDCTFKLFRRVVWERRASQLRPATLDAELLVGARRLGFVVADVPVSHHRPRRGASDPARAGIRVSGTRGVA